MFLASIDDLIQEEHFWRSVHLELVKQGHEHRNTPGNRLLYAEEDMAKQEPPTPDEMLYLRAHAITLVIENELYNWGSHKGKKHMEFVGAKFKPESQLRTTPF